MILQIVKFLIVITAVLFQCHDFVFDNKMSKALKKPPTLALLIKRVVVANGLMEGEKYCEKK